MVPFDGNACVSSSNLHDDKHIEGTIALATEPYGLRRTRYIGLAKTHLQNICVSLAINVARAIAWLAGKPHAQTRCSRFAALCSLFKHIPLPSPTHAATED
jgi:hypothetical protein